MSIEEKMNAIVSNVVSSMTHLKDVVKVSSATAPSDQLIYFGIYYTNGVKHFLIDDIEDFDKRVEKIDKELIQANPGFKDIRYLFAVAIEHVLQQNYTTERAPFNEEKSV